MGVDGFGEVSRGRSHFNGHQGFAEGVLLLDPEFYPSSLEEGLRSEQALNLALAEKHIQADSTRKVSHVVEKLRRLFSRSNQD